jgi:ketosteroid isomerase-like protein
MLDAYIPAVKAADLERIVSLYAEDAVMIRVGQVAEGIEAIRGWWTEYLANAGRIDDFTIEESQETDDLLMIDMILHTEFGTAEQVEFLMLEGELIHRHATAVTAMHLS